MPRGHRDLGNFGVICLVRGKRKSAQLMLWSGDAS